MKKLLLVAFFALLCTFGLNLLASCTPADRAAIVEATPAAERAACALIRATSTDGKALDLCVTADELAPLVPELLRARAENPPADAGAPLVAFQLSSKRSRAPPLRHCSQWTFVDAGALDAGAGP